MTTLAGLMTQACDEINRLRDERAALEEKARLLMTALEEGIELIEGNKTGSDWRLACHVFIDRARAAIRNAKGGE